MSQAEHTKAKQWRQDHNLSIDRLAELSGYSPEAIRWFEKGMTPPRSCNADRAIKPWVFQRYRLVCAGVDAWINGRTFNW